MPATRTNIGVGDWVLAPALQVSIRPCGLIRPFKGLLRPFKGLIRPFKGLIRPLKGLIRPFKGLMRPFKGQLLHKDL